MRVFYSSYAMAFDPPRGGERQLLDLAEAVKQKTNVAFYDLWLPRLEEADVFHYFSIGYGAENFFHHIKKRGIPLVLSPNIWITKENSKLLNLENIKLQLSYADKIIVNSEIEKNNFLEIFPSLEKKIEAILCGVSDVMFQKVDPTISKKILSLPNKYIVLAGEIDSSKKILELIKAVRLNKDLTLVMLGEILDYEYFKKCIEFGENKVLYFGSIPRRSQLFLSTLSGCFASISPAPINSPSFSAIESIAQDANVITTLGGSSTEYFGQEVFYVNPDKPEDYLAIFKTIESKKNNAGEKVELKHKLRASKAADMHIEIYKKLIKNEF